MDWGTVLSGVGGGLKGGLDVYSWQKQHDLDEQRLKQQDENARAKLEIQQLIAELNARTRTDIAGANNKTKTDIAGDTEFGRNMRWTMPSGNVIAQQQGAGDRLEATNAQRDEEEAGRTARWNAPSGSVRLQSETARYGMDTRSRDSRYSTDVGARTATRGQDLNYELGSDRNVLTGRGQDLNFSLDTTAEAGRDRRAAEAARSRFHFSYDTDDDTAVGTGRTGTDVNLPVPQPPPAPFIPRRPSGGAAVAPAGSMPVTPRAAAPAGVAPGPAAPTVDPRAQLATQIQALSVTIRQTPPAGRAALKAQLATLIAQYDSLAQPR